MKIICLGDSITAGYGLHRADGWVETAGKETGLPLINAGIAGDTTAGMLSRLERDALSKSPDILMLLGGTNDLLNGCPAGVVQSNIAAMIQQAQSAGVRTMLGTLPPVYKTYLPESWQAACAFGAPESEYAAFRRWQQAFAPAFDTALVDFYALLAPAAAASPSSLFSDGLHPNAQGHRMMAALFVQALQKML